MRPQTRAEEREVKLALVERHKRERGLVVRMAKPGELAAPSGLKRITEAKARKWAASGLPPGEYPSPTSGQVKPALTLPGS